MADQSLLDRLRKAFAGEPVTEQKMFGGVCFMLSGNMLVCSSNRGLLVRVGKEGHGAALRLPHASAMEMRGRPMEGYIFVAAEGTSNNKDLKAWIGRARAFVETLPPKAKKQADKAPRKAARKSH
jgi:TfoX/Sxy family transcriptional regulator of competence genes